VALGETPAPPWIPPHLRGPDTSPEIGREPTGLGASFADFVHRPTVAKISHLSLFPTSHLTTHHSMRSSSCRSDLPVRVLMVYPIRRFCDIVCPPGGRLKMRIGFSAGFCPQCQEPIAAYPGQSGPIRVNPAKEKKKKSPGFRLLAKFADERPCPVKARQSELR